MFGLFDKTFGVFLIKYETVVYMELCIYGSTFHFAMAQSLFLKVDKDGGLSTCVIVACLLVSRGC